MREIVLDTETTGLDPGSGHRLVEIGCVEIQNLVPTGAVFHTYLDPQRDMPMEAYNVHGLSADFLKGKPLFADIADDFLGFIGLSRLVIHNAEFDMRFLNAELKRSDMTPIGMERVFDTLPFARKKHPGASNTLDALCQRYRISAAKRVKHGALLDAELLAEVYTELLGGRQTALILASESAAIKTIAIAPRQARQPALQSALSESEAQSHDTLITTLSAAPVWRDYLKP